MNIRCGAELVVGLDKLGCPATRDNTPTTDELLQYLPNRFYLQNTPKGWVVMDMAGTKFSPAGKGTVKFELNYIKSSADPRPVDCVAKALISLAKRGVVKWT